MSALLELKDICFLSSEGEQLVDGLNLVVTRGEVLALLGPSGAGKTTTLRLIAGFERPSRGTVVFDGRVLEDRATHVAPEKRGVGFVFQDLALFPHLNVMENVLFGLHRLPRRERRKRANDMLDAVEMAGFAHRWPHELSGGEQQRVAVARTLAPSPSLVLLDEPFASLDPSLRERVRLTVREILKAGGMTAVLVTHDHLEAVAMADRIAVMHCGSVDKIEKTPDAYRHTRVPIVSELLGGSGLIQNRRFKD